MVIRAEELVAQLAHRRASITQVATGGAPPRARGVASGRGRPERLRVPGGAQPTKIFLQCSSMELVRIFKHDLGLVQSRLAHTHNIHVCREAGIALIGKAASNMI
jgi:hypothetical protein